MGMVWEGSVRHGQWSMVSQSGRGGMVPFTSSNESQGLSLSASHPFVHHTDIYTWFINSQNSVEPEFPFAWSGWRRWQSKGSDDLTEWCAVHLRHQSSRWGHPKDRLISTMLTGFALVSSSVWGTESLLSHHGEIEWADWWLKMILSPLGDASGNRLVWGSVSHLREQKLAVCFQAVKSLTVGWWSSQRARLPSLVFWNQRPAFTCPGMWYLVKFLLYCNYTNVVSTKMDLALRKKEESSFISLSVALKIYEYSYWKWEEKSWLSFLHVSLLNRGGNDSFIQFESHWWGDQRM